MTTSQIITRPCIGCGTSLDYQLTVWSDATQPEILPPLGAVAFKAGHICAACALVTTNALSRRRVKRPAADRLTFTYAIGTNSCVVSSVASAVAIWQAYLARTGYGVSEAGNGGPITDVHGRVLFRISYNGRVWDESQQRFADAG